MPAASRGQQALGFGKVWDSDDFRLEWEVPDAGTPAATSRKALLKPSAEKSFPSEAK